MHQVQDVAQIHKAGGGDEDDLQDPEAEVGDGEGAVIAGILAARLLRVTGEARQLITPDPLCGCPQHQDAEDEEDGEPDLPHHCGVLLGILQQPAQQAPVPHGTCCGALQDSHPPDTAAPRPAKMPPHSLVGQECTHPTQGCPWSVPILRPRGPP